MRKIIAILLVLLCFLASCGNSSTESTEIAEIELTTANIEDYLSFEFDYSKVERKKQLGISFGYTDITLRTYATSVGMFNNVEVTVKIELTNGWSVASSDEAYGKNDTEALVCTFRLPNSGEYTTTHDLIASIRYKDPDTKNIKYTITSVSGTFIPN